MAIVVSETITIRAVISTNTRSITSIAAGKMEVAIHQMTETDHMTLRERKNTAKKIKNIKRSITSIDVTTQIVKKVDQGHVRQMGKIKFTVRATNRRIAWIAYRTRIKRELTIKILALSLITETRADILTQIHSI